MGAAAPDALLSFSDNTSLETSRDGLLNPTQVGDTDVWLEMSAAGTLADDAHLMLDCLLLWLLTELGRLPSVRATANDLARSTARRLPGAAAGVAAPVGAARAGREWAAWAALSATSVRSALSVLLARSCLRPPEADMFEEGETESSV